MPKRKSSSYNGGPYKKPRVVNTARYNKLPKRAYTPSMVPMASRGYKNNPVEKKVNDTGVNAYRVNTTGGFILCALPILGSDMNNRIGRKIMMNSIYIKGRVQTTASTIATDNYTPAQMMRLILFCDYQPNGATPAITDVLVTAAPEAQLNLNNRDRFKVLWDKEVVLDPFLLVAASGGSCPNNIKMLKKYKKLNIETVFNATNGGTIADINSGALYLLYIGSTVSGTDDMTMTISTRVRYTDT